VYDTDDPTKPLEPGWFKLIRRNDRWPNDIPGRANQERCYHVEHVLEWQLLKKFIEEDKGATDSRCVFMYKYFVDPSQAIRNKKFKVKAAKDYGKLNTKDQFDYEDKDHDFSKFRHDVQDKNGKTVQVDLRPIDYISK